MSDKLRTPVGLPEDPEPFVGREREVRRLTDYLTDDQGPRPRVLVLHGTAGVGKSALAARLARETAARLGQPACWMPVLPKRPHADPDVPHLRLLGQLGAPRQPLFRSPRSTSMWKDVPLTEPVDLPGLVYRHITGHPVVVVIDDVSGRFEASRLLHGFEGTGAVVIFTSDAGDWGDMPGASESPARVHEVRPLHDAHARTLLTAVGTASPGAPPRATGNLPVFLRIAASDPAPDHLDGPTELVARACRRLHPDAEDMLLRLVRSDLREFDEEIVRTVLLFPPPDERLTALIHELCASGLAQRVRARRFQVHPEVRALLEPQKLRRLPDRWRALHDAAVERVEAALHGANGPLLQETIDGWLELIQQMVRVPSVGSVHLAGALARYLAEQGDPHRLFALRSIVAHHVLPDTASSLVVPTAMAARRMGQLDQAEHLLHMVDRHTAAPELALVLRDNGRLLEAIAVLDAEHPEGSAVVEDPPALLARGALRCEQGWHEEAERALAQAAFGYEEREEYRNAAWAWLEQSRCALLLGRPQAAERLLEAAEETFRNLEDTRGLAWVATESGRLHILRGSIDARARLHEADALHRAAEDPRGAAWTGLHRSLIEQNWNAYSADRWPLTRWPARASDDDADRLLRAWQLHFSAEHEDTLSVVANLERSASLFAEMGCRRGQAWSLLALGLRNLAQAHDDDVPRALEHLGEANRLFQSIGDATGKCWQQYVRRRRRVPRRLWDVLGPEDESPDLPFWWAASAGAESPPHALPVAARLAMLPVSALGSAGNESAWAADACRVRLTLLDDLPTVHADARILLRVEPGARHRWADLENASWLQAVAVPLTRGTLVPHSVLFRASAQAEHGAEFLFRSERPGRHRLRFTIVDDASGTVLQQIETEIDLTDATPDQAALLPFPYRIKGR
ncbi:ATP-binding protein [Streptomyces sp. S9]|nr:ATP-binding protein [Streptomyces sp. S9]